MCIRDRKKVPIYMVFFDQVPLPAGPQEGPETALCGTVKAARWQQNNIGVRFHWMTSHKNDFGTKCASEQL